MPRPTESRDRLLDASAQLFRRRGYAGTGLKDIAATGDAPIGSLYHFFPGGKTDLGVQAVLRWGGDYEKMLDEVLSAANLGDATKTLFDVAADALVDSDFADGCPIASVAIESAGNAALRAACAGVFERWLARLDQEFRAAGRSPVQAAELATFVLSALEGAYILAKTGRSTEPLATTSRMVISLILASPNPPATPG
jgi:AcrR family transcriptional regulator